MNALRASLALAGVVALVLAPPLFAQAPNFDDKATGFLTANIGGMPADAWNGTSLGTAKQLVSALPAAPRSRALRDLQFTVLVSALSPPAPDGSPPPGLFARKVEKLAAMGEGESLNEMVRSAGGYLDPAAATTVVNAMMMAGEREGACSIARNWQLTEPFGRRANAACDYAAGVKTGQIDGPSMMMLDLTRAQPPAGLLRATQPPIIRALVALKALPIATRLEIAERGEALAVIEATRLGDLYVEAVRDGAALPPAMAARAQLVAAARSASNPAEIMNSIAAVYTEARGSPLFPTIARASAAGLLRLPARPQFASVAQEAMVGFLLLGDKQQTRAWTQLALNAARNNAGALTSLDRLMPLVAVAGIDDRWYEAIRRDDPARAPLRGYLLLELFRATGIDVPQSSTDLPEAPPGNVRLIMPPAATLQALQAAAAGRRRAETALLASIAAGETPLNELHPAAVAAIVRALRQVGEDHAGRLFAIETAIAYGL